MQTSISNAFAKTGVTRTTIRNWIARGKLPSVSTVVNGRTTVLVDTDLVMELKQSETRGRKSARL